MDAFGILNLYIFILANVSLNGIVFNKCGCIDFYKNIYVVCYSEKFYIIICVACKIY